MRHRPLLPAICAALVVGCGGGAGPAIPPEPSPASAPTSRELDLVLTVVIDGLRTDTLAAGSDRLGAGGFARLSDRGARFEEARYPYCTTLTAVGHASIYTGGAPVDHGIVGNYWLDRRSGEVISSVEGPAPEDPDQRVIGPTQLLATTIGDELVAASGGRSRVFSVSVKDRGAILPGGRSGKAFWFSKDEGEFVTSAYYYPDGAPAWLADWNRTDPAGRYRDRSWELSGERATYTRAGQDDRPEERPYNEPFGRSATFPHSLAGSRGADFFDQLRHTPFADELTVDLVGHLLVSEQVGRRGPVDMLAVSLSATDAIGHAYGPESLEYEDNLRRLDRTLARLLDLVDEAVGLERALIVLTADHGVDAIPEYRRRLGLSGKRIDAGDFARVIDGALQRKHGTALPFTVVFRNPSIYLNLETIEKLGLDVAEVEAEAARAVMTIDGIAAALTRTDLLAGNVPDDPLTGMLKLAFHPERSGNVLVYQQEHAYLYHHHRYDAAMHGAPYDYDTHVPLFLAGPVIEPQVVDRPVTPLDIAPTIAEILEIPPPSGSRGAPLAEVLE